MMTLPKYLRSLERELRPARTSRSTSCSVELLEERVLLALVPVSRPVPAIEGFLVDNQVVFSFANTGRPAPASSFVATINWGDGTPATAGTVVERSGGYFDVTGSHTYAEEKAYPIHVTIGDTAGDILLPTAFQASHVTLEPLVADVSTITADNHDAHLVNPWGIAFDAGGPLGVTGPTGAGGPIWVADNSTAFSTLYDGTGVPQPLVVTTPNRPTGVVFNSTRDFSIGGLHTSFLFADQQGEISGWTYAADAHFGTAVVAATAPTSANYTGLALATGSSGNLLYAANFSAGGEIDAYNASFGFAGRFTDPTIPVSFLPYNVQNIGGNLYVTYAQPNAYGLDAAPGGGYVDEFSPDGILIRRVISNDHLSAPWGIVQAPGDFGAFSNDLLVANHGDGTISAYNIATGAFLGSLTDATSHVVTISGLKGLSFGNDVLAGLHNTLYYTAGANGGADGVMGSLSLSSYAVVADARLTSLPAHPVAPSAGQSFTAVLSTFTDADPQGTLGPPSDYFAVINWGDGTTSQGVIAYDGAPKDATFSVSGTHAYAQPGTYEYTVTVYDVGGSVTITSNDLNVTQIPSASTSRRPKEFHLARRSRRSAMPTPWA